MKGLPPEDPALDVDAVALLACWGPKIPFQNPNPDVRKFSDPDPD